MLSMKSANELLDQWFPSDDVSLQELRAQVQNVQLPAGYMIFFVGVMLVATILSLLMAA